MSFKPYPKYKDSGVEWLGKVPEHWEVMPFKWHLSRNDGGVWGDEPDGEKDTIVLRSTEQTVDGHWKIEDPALRKISEDEMENAVLEIGDLLLTKSSGSSLHIGKTSLVTREIAEMKCCYSNFMQRLRTNPSLHPKLAWYVLNNNLARKQFDLLSNSTTGLANLNGTVIGHILIPISPITEQSSIASFLDHETSKIDSLIKEQEKLIELLKEKRIAVISHAVTKGLNENVKMKDSGVEWLGMVPEHWEVKPLFGCAKERSERNVGMVNNNLLSLSYGRIIQKDISSSDGLLPESFETYQIVHDGDSVLRLTDLQNDKRSLRSGLVTQEGIITSAYVAVQPTGMEAIFFSNLLRAYDVTKVFYSMGGGLRQSMKFSDLKRLPVLIPPISEQSAIASFLDHETAKIDSLIAEQEKLIELLKEKRSAVISAAVTGQIDVRGFVSPKAA